MGVWGEPRTKWVSERAASVTVVTGGHRVRSREPLESEEKESIRHYQESFSKVEMELSCVSWTAKNGGGGTS